MLGGRGRGGRGKKNDDVCGATKLLFSVFRRFPVVEHNVLASTFSLKLENVGEHDGNLIFLRRTYN
jgi:hypothetical protein